MTRQRYDDRDDDVRKQDRIECMESLVWTTTGMFAASVAACGAAHVGLNHTAAWRNTNWRVKLALGAIATVGTTHYFQFLHIGECTRSSAERRSRLPE